MKPIRNRRNRRRRGFTLIEVLLVLTILVILASLVIVNYRGAQQHAFIDAARTQIHNLEQPIEMYYMDCHDYPPTLDALAQSPGDQNWRGPYVKKLPMDPWGQPYQYQYDANKPRIWSFGPDRRPGTADDIDNYME